MIGQTYCVAIMFLNIGKMSKDFSMANTGNGNMSVAWHVPHLANDFDRIVSANCMDYTHVTIPLSKSTYPEKCCILQQRENKEMQDAR